MAWIVACALAAGPAAALVDVRIGTCTIVVVAPGALAVSPDLRTLSTGNSGGRPARVRVSTQISGSVPHTTCSLVAQVNCFRVTVVPPDSFSVSPSGAAGAASFAGGWREPGNPILPNLLSAVILNGERDLDLHLTATSLRGTFAAGRYEAEETIRCE